MISKAMKRFLSLSLLLILSLSAFAQRPKVGVVLCGGGAKGAAHVGVLKVLEENNIPIDCIVGTSMGAIVGGLYAIGYSANELDSLIMAQDWNVVMSDRIPRGDRSFERKQFQNKFLVRIPFGAGDYSRLGARSQRKPEENSFLSNIPMALVNGQNVYNLFTRLSVGYQDSLDFNRMPIPFACVAVDLVSKKEVHFHSGRFVDAIRSSMAIPAYFTPVRMGDMVLIDGGALNNYPVDVCRKMGADIIIGVKLGAPEDQEPTDIENIGDMMGEMLDLFLDTKLEAAIADTDILIEPSTKGYGVLSFDNESLRTLIGNGEAAARAKESELIAMKEWLDRSESQFIGPVRTQPPYRKALRMDRDSILLGHVSFNGLTSKDAQMLLGKSRLQPGARISGKELESEIDRFYNTAAFESVTYVLHGQTEPFDLELNFVQGRKSMLGVGVRFDSEEVAAVLLDVGFNANALYGSQLNVTAKLAYNLQASLQYNYVFRSLARFRANYTFRHSDLNILNQGKRSNLDFMEHSFKVSFATAKIRDIAFELGGRFDIFDYNTLLSEAETLPIYDTDLSRNKYLSAFASFQVDQLDQPDFPMKGFKFNGLASYYFNRLFGDYENFLATQIHLTGVIPVGKRFAFLLSLDNRILFGNNIPLIHGNIMGGTLAGRYMDQQLPYLGFGYTHVFQNVLTSISLDTRYRILDNHYVFLSGAYARDFQNFKTIFDHKPMFGARLGYAYNSAIGPIAGNLFWSNYTGKVGAYISIGYNF